MDDISDGLNARSGMSEKYLFATPSKLSIGLLEIKASFMLEAI